VLTHFHGDHTGSAAEIRAWSDAPVIAHWLDAPMIRGELPAPAPNLTDWEQTLFERFGKDHPVGPPVHVDREVTGGEVLDFGGGAHILAVPGHTDGSIAILLPEHGTLFTDDTIAESSGDVMLGVFNTDRARESFRRMENSTARSPASAMATPSSPALRPASVSPRSGFEVSDQFVGGRIRIQCTINDLLSQCGQLRTAA
jgi:glyoxylase-like metal-dependent hydrolase (beta-lactamase superfamily II)